MRTRLAIGAAGVLLGLFGAFRLLTQIPGTDLLVLAVWLGAALVLHDGLLSAVVLAVGAAVTAVVPLRARRYLQGGLVAAALVTVVALPLIRRQGSQPQVKAILQQDYTANLAVLLGIVAGGTLLLYVLRVVRDAQAVSVTKVRPSDDQHSVTE